MNRTSAARLTGAVLLATGVATAFSVPAIADPAAPAAASSSDTASYSPELLAAMQRDLGLNADQARERLVNDAKAGDIESKAKGALGDTFAGAWIDSATGKLTVGTTDASKAGAARGTGADVKVVKHSQKQLNGVKAVLDTLSAPASVTSWRVDDTSNTVVVEVSKAERNAATEAFLATVRSISPAVAVTESTQSPRPLYNTVGGQAYYMGGGRCSIGFAVVGGFVSAGHCGTAGTTTTGYNQVSQGTFRGSSFPGNDYSWVATNSNWTSQPWVDQYNGYAAVVKGSTEAAAGASVCRSGSTTGWHCGTIQAKNSTVNYSQGAVYGLTRTNACAEPGDSGGSWISGNQAQGVTSGGSGDCTSGGTTYFQPVNEILSAYGLRLVTG